MQDEEETTEDAPEDTETPGPESAPEEATADDDVPADPEPVPEAPVAEAQADGDSGPEIVSGPSPEEVNAQGPEPFNQPSFAEHQEAKQAELYRQRTKHPQRNG